jgi:hypothetical protein
METWRDIPGVPFYQASGEGRVKSLTRIVEQACRWGGTVQREFVGRVLVSHPNSHGYLMVSVGSPAKSKTVHSLVARAFLGEIPEGCQVNHKDGDKTNNRPENLEYITSTENNCHALRTGLRKIRITDEQIEEIKELMGCLSQREIGRRYGIHHTYVRYIADGRRVITGV